MITAQQAEQLADEWIAAWNAHDLPRVLAHYTDDFTMASPKIVDIAGEPSGVLHGKPAVAAYWTKALAMNRELHFHKLGVLVGATSIAVFYRNQTGVHAVEVLELGPDGRVARAAAHYG